MPLLRRVLPGRPITIAVAAAALAFLWQALTVRYNYGGNWTGLFCTGANQRVPPGLGGEAIFVRPGSDGYDGQFYHYIAHDPLGRGALPDYVDAPRLRYARILVPGLAYLLAGGQSRFIDAAYFGVVLLFVFLGAFWLARLAPLHGQPAAWGFLFLVFPATAVSVDRMTVDVALAALWAGFAVFWKQGRKRWILLILALAPLVRETGLALVAAYCLCSISRRAYGKAVLSAAAALPLAAWRLHVWSLFPSYHVGWLATVPLGGLSSAVATLVASPWTMPIAGVAGALSLVAVTGSLAAVVLAFRYGLRPFSGLLEAAIAVQGGLGVLMVVFGSADIWVHVYGHARLLTPLLVLLAWRALERRSWSDLAPLALLTPAVCLQMGGDALRIVRGVWAGVAG